MADGRVEIDARINNNNVRRDVQNINRELNRIGGGMNRTARDMRNTVGREMQGMVGDSEYYARQYRRAYGDEIGGLMHDVGGNYRYMSQEARNMMMEMQQGFYAQKLAMIPFMEDQIKATYGYYKMAQGSKDFQGTNKDFINQANDIGKAMKASQDAQINANRLAMMGMLQTIGAMNAMSSLASKTTKNLDQMKNPLYNTARPALALVDNLDRIARSGSAAQIALELHGPQASMKTLTDEAMRLNSVMMGMPILAMGVGLSMLFMYGSLHKANMEMEPKYAEAFTNMMEKLTKALEPMRQAFTAVMVPIYNFVAKMAELTIAFNEAHPVMARFIQGTIMLVPALMGLLLPLGLGVGYFRGLRAILFALRPLMMPIITAFATMSTPVWIVAAAITGATVAFTHFYKTNEKFKGFVDGTIKSIKDFSSNLVKNGKELLNNAYKSDMVQNSIKAMQKGLNVAGQKSKEFGLNMVNMGKYLYETAKSGDAMNEWVGHLPEPFQASAEKVGQSVANIRTSILSSIPVIQSFGQNMASMGKYLFYTALDGDYLNDWITHLPEGFQGAALKIGLTMSSVRESIIGTFPAIQQFGQNVMSMGKYLMYTAIDGDYFNDWVTHLPEPFQNTALQIGMSVANIRQTIIDWVSSTVAEGARMGVTLKDMGMYFLEVARTGDFANESLMKLPVNMIMGVKQMGIALAEFRADFIATFPVIGEFGQNLLNLGQYILQVVLTGDIMNSWLSSMSGGFQNVAILIGTAIEQIKTSIGYFVEAIRLAMGGDTSQLGQIFTTILPTLITILIGGLPGLLLTALRFLPTIVEGINQMLPGFLETAGSIILRFIETIVGMIPTILQVGIDIISTIITGITTSLPIIVQAAIDIIVNTSNAFFSAVTAVAPSLINAGLDMILKIQKGLTDNLPKILEMGLTIIENLLEGISNMLPKIIESGITIITKLLEGIVQRFPQWIQNAYDMMNKFLDSIIKHLPTILQTGIDILMKLIDGIVKVLPRLLDAGLKMIIQLAKGLVDNFPTILEKGIQIVESIIRGIIRALPGLLKKAWELTWEFIKVIVANLPQILETGVKLLIALINGIVKTVGRLSSTIITEVIGAILKCFSNAGTMLKSIGKDIIQGLINGISSMVGKAVSAVKSVASNIKDGIADFFDIHSPSRLMYGMGKFVTEGLANGIVSLTNLAVNKAKTMAEAVADGFSSLQEDIVMGDIIGGGIDNAALNSAFSSSKRFVNDMVNVNPTAQQAAYIAPKQERQVKTTPQDSNQSDQNNTYIVMDKKVVGEVLAQPVETTNNRRKQRLAQFKPTVTPSF
ncbi:carbamoyl-phosphate synthase large subunit [Bacillus cereus group sp. BfR-BA-02490]|uniref:phage tail protein n=1 Tax=Bacillus cereus group sp. BfR-BA-02490 TaxID=3094888 RepID=UPI0029C1D781|nr:carbamoyl-phosphate synthase large subunit [Bacillus cereus group sp. BfR-BA-02490]MDX5824221.1 carbamoyl-phosphate synthase large subunit [Bacillus cereus group sp. BfR-BA-02490]